MHIRTLLGNRIEGNGYTPNTQNLDSQDPNLRTKLCACNPRRLGLRRSEQAQVQVGADGAYPRVVTANPAKPTTSPWRALFLNRPSGRRRRNRVVAGEGVEMLVSWRVSKREKANRAGSSFGPGCGHLVLAWTTQPRKEGRARLTSKAPRRGPAARKKMRRGSSGKEGRGEEGCAVILDSVRGSRARAKRQEEEVELQVAEMFGSSLASGGASPAKDQQSPGQARKPKMGDWVWGLKMGQGCCGGARATLSSRFSHWSEWQEQAAEVRIFTLALYAGLTGSWLVLWRCRNNKPPAAPFSGI